jgi:cardiolipin synthase
MKLIVQPDHGLEPVLTAIDKAKRTLDVVIFRLDIKDVVNGFDAAVKRGVAVRALIAHTNKGGEKALRKLEARLLAAGVTVSRTAETLVRYHAKMMIVDDRTLHVNGFNFTWLDVERSRSFGIISTAPRLVKDALRLFQADCDRQPFASACEQLVVSPENARTRLTAFIKGAKKQLLIYDPNVGDARMLRLLAEREHAGVDVRIIGAVGARAQLKAQKFPGKRLHVRAIMRDGSKAFVGSQSLRGLELDRRREVGVLVAEPAVVRKMVAVFEEDWAKTPVGEAAAKAKAERQGNAKAKGKADAEAQAVPA